MERRLLSATLALLFLFSSIAYSQQPAGTPPVQAPSSPQVITMPAQLPASPQSTPQQAEAVEAIKAKPEFKSLTPEEILKGKELLEKKEAEKKEPPKKEEPEVTEKTVIKQEEKSLFDRFRVVGQYQDIDTNLKPFGYEFFSTSALQIMTPRKDIPVSSEYIVGTGDEVKMLLWGRINAQYDLVVDRDGNITVPQIGPLHVAGMTYEQMATYLIKQAEQIVGANINVTMGALKSIQVFVLGEVRRPGSYALDSFSTITNAILAAGGPSEIGSIRNVKLIRNNKTIVQMDFYDFLLKGDKSKDKVLGSGDIVFISTVGPLVGIAGNVKRPAIYELKNKYDLQNLFDLAGGIIPTAYTQQIQVERIQKNEKQVVVDINDKDLTKAKDFMLQDADLVKVFTIVEKDTNAVYLYGNLKRPGKYEYKPGMRVKDLIKDTTELLQETHFEYALIKRLMLPDFRTELIPFNLGRLLLDNDAANNIELNPQDNIYIFSKWFFKDKPFVIVEGEVRKGSRFVLNENMRIKDAILSAGDITKDAYLQKAEIIRVNNKREFKTIYFNVTKALAEDPEENLPLQDEDKIIIHSVWEERWKEMVSVSGEVKKPQEFVLTESMAVTDLIFKAGGLTRDSYLEDAELYRTDWRTKEVTLQRFNLKKALEGDTEHNIKLKDLDKVVIHSIWEKVYKKTVSVDGEVSKPGTYQYAEKMTVKDLVFTAGNVFESAYLEEAEVSSQIIEEGKTVRIEHRKINLRKALEGDPAHNLSLKPYDRLFVKRLSDWRKEQFVNISGEVSFPGRYIIKKGERLSSIIERAGGFTDKAYLRGAAFTRERVRQLQQIQLDEMAERLERELMGMGGAEMATALSPEEAQIKEYEIKQKRNFVASLKVVKAKGRMAIKIEQPELLKKTHYDIELEEGDSLFIPSNPQSVQVIGSVYNQTAFVYDKDKGYSRYIDLAGGYTENADKNRLYILKVDGTAVKPQGGFLGISWSKDSNRWEFGSQDIEPGDTIVVPEKIERIAWMREIKDITQILYQIAVTAGVLIVAF